MTKTKILQKKIVKLHLNGINNFLQNFRINKKRHLDNNKKIVLRKHRCIFMLSISILYSEYQCLQWY